MPTTRPIHLGYNPPSSDRRLTSEPFRPATFAADVDRAVTLALDGGFDSVWVSDHVMSDDRYRLEAWTLLCWIASRHPGATLGTSVLVDAFRHPPLLAKMVATLTALTDCPMIVGYGAGWEEAEFRAYGYPFRSGRERVERMDDSLDAMRRLWSGGPIDHTGPHITLEGAILEPRPDPAPLLMVGGESRRTIEVAVRRADWWNIVHVPDEPPTTDGPCGRDVRGAWPRPLDAPPVGVPQRVPRGHGRGGATGGRSTSGRATAALRRDAGGPGGPSGGLQELGFDAFQLVFGAFPATSDMELFLGRTLPALRGRS